MYLSIYVKHWLYVSHCGRHRHAQVFGKVTVPTLIKDTVCFLVIWLILSEVLFLSTSSYTCP